MAASERKSCDIMANSRSRAAEIFSSNTGMTEK